MTDTKKLLKDINKDRAEGSLQIAGKFKESKIDRVTSGSLYLDRLLGTNEGVSGWPLGRVVELFGPEGSGKSTLAMKTMAESIKRGKIGVYFDTEKTFDPLRAEQIGIDVDKVLLSKETIGEDVIDMVCEILERKEEGIEVIVIDSVASMIPLSDKNKSMRDPARMASLASLMSSGLRKILSVMHNKAIVFFINQLRENPAGYGNPEYTPGGRSLPFYASIRVDLRAKPKERIKEGKKVIGQLTWFDIVKNKTALPYQSGSFKMMYDGSFDQVDELINIGLLDNKIIAKVPYYYIGDDGWKGKDNLAEALQNDPKLFEKLKKEVFG